MGFEPQKFFIGVIDLFSVLLPGGALAYAARYLKLDAKSNPQYLLDSPEHWLVFLFAAYLLGHLVFLFGALLDIPYDWIRRGTNLGQNARLAKGKRLSPRSLRALARLLFHKDADAALVQAIRIKSRALATLGAPGAINAFQWSKARLSMEHGEALTAVQRLEADSKFFRSVSIMLLGFLVVIYRSHREYTWWCALLLVATLWRYADQRFKSTQLAYWSIIALESAKIDVSPKPESVAEGALTHAGGIVYRSGEEGYEYLLVQASKDRTQWVLPKGHIEAGEAPRDAAVREVQEETAVRARIVDWLADVPLGQQAPLVRFFLMEFVEAGRRPNPEDRQVSWRKYEAAMAGAFPETRQLLEQANYVFAQPQ